MRPIAVVGAGQAGLLISHGLLREGYRVRLFSDKRPETILNETRPTGTAARFESSLCWERELGLNHWDDEAPRGQGVHLTFWPGSPDYPLMTMLGRLQRPFIAIDLRLQSHRWMKDFVDRGGALEIERVTVERLDEIAAEHDLTIVAAGRSPLMRLFARDEARSTYTAPQRLLAMVNVIGPALAIEGCPYLPVKFNFFARYGEAFWVPWHHKSGRHGWSLVFEIKEGGPFDRFRGLRDGDEALRVAKQAIREMIPGDYPWVKDAELADERAWLTGSVLSEIRDPVGTLPSGRHVLALGDTAQSLDPTGGQGANNGNKMARNLLRCIVERGDAPFDRPWMTHTFNRFWARNHWTEKFNNTLLEPLTGAGIQILLTAYGSTGRSDDHSPQQAAADAIVANFNDPSCLTAEFHDGRLAREWIKRTTGRRFAPIARGLGRVIKAQLRMRAGMRSGHPGIP